MKLSLLNDGTMLSRRDVIRLVLKDRSIPIPELMAATSWPQDWLMRLLVSLTPEVIAAFKESEKPVGAEPGRNRSWGLMTKGARSRASGQFGGNKKPKSPRG